MIYEAVMSRGDKIKIDEEDLEKLQENIKAPFVRVKQAIINPSFLVMIVPTNEPDVRIVPTLVRPKFGGEEGASIEVVGTKEVKVLSDLMGADVKRLKS